jgi:hypothetical protein
MRQQYALELRLRDGRIAPIPAVRDAAIEPRESTQSRRSLPSIAMLARAPKPTISRQRSERQRTLQLLFVAPSPGPVILINHVPVIQLGLDALEKMCRAP